MHDRESGRGQVLCTAGVGRGDHEGVIRVDTPDHLQFPSTDLAGQIGMQERVSTSGTTAQAIVVDLDDVDHVFETPTHRLMDSLDVPKMARVLENHPSGSRSIEVECVEMVLEPFVYVDDTSCESSGLVGTDQVPVILQRRSATGRIDDHGAVTRKRRHGMDGSLDRSLMPTGVRMEGPAAMTSGRNSEVESEGFDQVGEGAMNGSEPGVHDATGEDPDVGFRRRRAKTATEATRDRADSTGRDAREPRNGGHSSGGGQETTAGQQAQAEA